MSKNNFFIALVIIHLTTLYSYACDVEFPVRHTNPDGSIGGLKDIKSFVSEDSYLGINALVCGNASVSEGAKVLDFAKVQDYSVIKGTVVVRGNSQIRDNALIEGKVQSPTLVEDNVVISENSRVSFGSIISGYSFIHGNVKILASSIIGNANVCGDFRILNAEVNDSRYCSTLSEVSFGKISSINIEEGVLNKPLDVRFKIESEYFNDDPNLFILKINGIETREFSIFAKTLEVKSTHLLKDGQNSIYLKGKDSLGKDLEFILDFFSGSKKIKIPLDSFKPDKLGSKVEAFYFFDGLQYKVKSVLNGSELTLLNLPDNKNGELSVQISNSLGFAFDKKLNQSNFSSMKFISFPDISNGNLDFSEGLKGWSFNGNGQVQVKVDQDRKYVSLDSPNGQAYSMLKTFNLEDVKSLNVSLRPQALTNPNSEIEVFLYSHRIKLMQRFTIKSSELSQSQMNLNEELFSSGFGTEVGGQFSIAYRINSAGTKIDGGGFDIFSLTPMNYFVDFKPHDLGVHIIKRSGASNEEIPYIDTYSQYDCSLQALENYAFMIDDSYRNLYRVVNKPLVYFSAGPNSFLEKYENRIRGELTVAGFPEGSIGNIFLEISQRTASSSKIFEVPLHRCLKISDSWKGTKLKFNLSNHLGKYLFSVPDGVLRSLDAESNSTVSFRIIVQNILGARFPGQNLKPFKMLKMPELSSGYGVGIDNYDSNALDKLKTGGDKWADPRIEQVFSPMIRKANQDIGIFWKINDISKINGDSFPPHAGHKNGDDFDITFLNEIYSGNSRTDFDFDNYAANEDKWVFALKKIENFLKDIEPYYKDVFEIYLQDKYSGSNGHYVRNYFHNRCLVNRYIDIDEREDDLLPSKGSLISNVPPHVDHFHIRFNNSRIRDDRNNVIPPVPPIVTDDEFRFFIDQNNVLHVSLSEPEKFLNTRILWRAQVEKEPHPFKKVIFNNFAETGEIVAKIPEDWDSFYLEYMLVSNNGDGGCTKYVTRLGTKRHSKSKNGIYSSKDSF